MSVYKWDCGTKLFFAAQTVTGMSVCILWIWKGILEQPKIRIKSLLFCYHAALVNCWATMIFLSCQMQSSTFWIRYLLILNLVVKTLINLWEKAVLSFYGNHCLQLLPGMPCTQHLLGKVKSCMDQSVL